MTIDISLDNAKLIFTRLMRNYDPNFNADKVLDQKVREIIRGEGDSIHINTYLIQDNLVDVRGLLDRLLILRRELWELDALREKTALGYLSAISSVESENEIILAQSKPQFLPRITLACKNRSDSIRKHIDTMESRHVEAGSSLNFDERMAKLTSIYLQDIESCYYRSNAVQEGAENCYGVSLVRPTPDKLLYVSFQGASHLDDWVAWHRKLSRELEELHSIHSLHEVSISLGTPYQTESTPDDIHNPDKVTTRQCIFFPDFVDTAKGDGFFKFSLKSLKLEVGRIYFVPSGYGMCLLQELAVTVDVTKESRHQGWRFILELKAPDGQKVSIIADTENRLIDWISSPAFVNRLADGDWELSVVSAFKSDGTDVAQGDRALWPITDIKLFLRVLSRRNTALVDKNGKIR